MAVAVERLKRRADFLSVADTRRRHATPGLVLQARRRDTSGATEAFVRVGFTATRKIGNAVIRNRARRRLRAAAAAILPHDAAPGHDYVLIARSGTIDRPYDKLLADLRAALAAVAPRARGNA
jgi:ribonuclease P protein component